MRDLKSAILTSQELQDGLNEYEANYFKKCINQKLLDNTQDADFQKVFNNNIKQSLDDYNNYTQNMKTIDSLEAEIEGTLSSTGDISEAVKDYTNYDENMQMMNNLQAEFKDSFSVSTDLNTDIPDSEDHIYPVAMVVTWTNKIKAYNKQLDLFLAGLARYDADAHKEWVKAKVRKFCSYINYMLAWVRYYIIKALNGMYKKVQAATVLIEPLISPPTSIQDVITWLGHLVDVFLKPYKQLIQFIKDFVTYSPPLCEEAASLVSRIAQVPGAILSKLKKIFAATVAGVLEGISIKFEPITLGDIINGNTSKPKREEFNIPASTRYYCKQLNDLLKEKESLQQDIEATEMLDEFIDKANKEGGLVWEVPQKDTEGHEYTEVIWKSKDEVVPAFTNWKNLFTNTNQTRLNEINSEIEVLRNNIKEGTSVY